MYYDIVIWNTDVFMDIFSLLLKDHCMSSKTTKLETKTVRMKEDRIIHPVSKILQNSKYILCPALLVRWSYDSWLQSNAPSQEFECSWFSTLIGTSQLNSLQIEHSYSISKVRISTFWLMLNANGKFLAWWKHIWAAGKLMS